MKSRIITYMVGILSGVLICVIYGWTTQNYSYVVLPRDYEVGENGGLLKKGVKLRVDEGFGEGFTRYILYLNIRDSEPIELDSEVTKYDIKPYWLQPIDTLK